MSLELRPYQKEAIDAAAKDVAELRSALIVAPTACHCESDEILMADGSIKLAKDVIIGDKLIGRDGGIRNVLETHRGFSDLYRVSSDKFDSYTVSKGHLLCLYRTPEEAGKKPSYETIPVENWNEQSKWFKHIRYIYRAGVELDFGSDYSPEISPYVLGMIICDGTQRTLDVTKAYPEWIEFLQHEADKFGVSVNAQWIENKNSYIMKFSVAKGAKNPMKDAIKNMMDGDMRKIPDRIKTAPANVRRELLSGILDGDGHLNGNGLYELTFKQKELVEDVRFIALSLGLNVSTVKTKPVQLQGWLEPRDYYRIHIGGDTHKIPCRIKKTDRPSSVTKNSTISRFSVKFIGRGNYYGWSVDGDNMYLLADTQVIHNSGKSVIIAGIVQRALAKNPLYRILVLCSTKEILEQNETQIKRMATGDVGIYCAGAGRREYNRRVVVASRDSLSRCPEVCGKFDGVLLDEAHQLSLDGDDSYTRIIDAVNKGWLVGLTGTPWRLSGGNIWGEKSRFKRISYNIPMGLLIKQGFLSPYVFPRTATQIDTSGLKKQNGDFVAAQIERAANVNVCRAAIMEWARLAEDRRVSLFFCATRSHGRLVAALLREYGVSTAYLDGTTDKKERALMVEGIKAGTYKAVVNIGTLTTGFDAPIIDCVVFLRPTASASLFVQMAGRGLRKFEGKENCLYLDMAGNFSRFRSIETPKASRPSGTGEAVPMSRGEVPTTKPCPECGYPIGIRATQCPYCDAILVKHDSKPFTGNEQASGWLPVLNTRIEDHISAKGNACWKVSYFTLGKGILYEYFVKANGAAARRFIERKEQIDEGLTALRGTLDGRFISVENVVTRKRAE